MNGMCHDKNRNNCYCLRNSLSEGERKKHVIFRKRNLREMKEIQIFKSQLINRYSIKYRLDMSTLSTNNL